MITAWIWLQEIVQGISTKGKLRLIDHFSDPERIFYSDFSSLKFMGITWEVYESFFNEQALDQARIIAERLAEKGINHITRQDPRFIGGDWLVLYYKGKLATNRSMAVIGTRQSTAQGQYYANLICADLIKKGVTINSGLAEGIDYHAHRSALDRGGRTQAFLAHGLDDCYPREHRTLLAAIIENGAAITPFTVCHPPFRHRFAMRNALMAAWSDEVLVVEAPRKSGALMTAELARRMGKQIWTVETSSTLKVCSGNRLLLELGAKPYRILDHQPLPDPVPNDELIKMLRIGPRTTDELVAIAHKPFNQLADQLLQKSLDHWVVFSGDGKWHYNGW